MPFQQALKNFKKTKCFEFSDGNLSRCHLESIAKSSTPDSLHQQFYLKNVTLDSYDKNQEQPIVGAITTREYAPKWCDKRTDVYLRHLSTASYTLILRSNFGRNIVPKQEDQEKTQRHLLLLLTTWQQWEVIVLDHIQVNWYDHDCHLLWNPRSFIDVLKNNPYLTRLHCDLSTHYENAFQAFTQAIAKHPGLRELNLQSTVLNKADYRALEGLFDANYRIEKLVIAAPQTAALQAVHAALVSRLSKAPAHRFVSEQLNQEKVLTLAAHAIATGNQILFNILLKQAAEVPALTWKEKERAYASLPDIYRKNKTYVENNEVLLQLDLSRKRKPNCSKSVGYYLLERAFAVNNFDMIKGLLASGANPVERLDECSLVVRLFKNWKQWSMLEQGKIVERLQQEWPVLLPQIIHLEPFPGIYNKLTGIKQFLDNYLLLLIKRKESSLSEVRYRLEERTQEWLHALHTIVRLIEQGTQRPEINVDQLERMIQCTEQLTTNAQQAKRGKINSTSKLNDGLEQLGEELKLELINVKQTVAKHSLQLQRLETELSKERAGRAQDKAEMEEKLRIQQEEWRIREEEFKVQEEQLQKQGEIIGQFRQLLEQHGFFASTSFTPTANTAEEPAANDNTKAPFFKR